MRRVVISFCCWMGCRMGVSVMGLDYWQRVNWGLIIVIANLAVWIDLVRVPTVSFGLFHI